MIFLQSFITMTRVLSGETILNILIQVFLIAFKTKNVVSFWLDNLLGNVGLGPHSIYADDCSRQIKAIQDFWNGLQFIAFFCNSFLSKA